jgi:hypothetical protein
VDYREVDLSRLRTVSIADRSRQVDVSRLARPPAGRDPAFRAFLDSLPRILAAEELRRLARLIAEAHRTGRGTVLLVGGPVIKTGLGPLLVDWIGRGIATHLALNGAAAIHDFELAAFGATSEDVEAGLADGTFGMAEETGSEMNRALREGAARRQGAGQALASWLARRSALAAPEVSVLIACHRHGVPVTVHAAIGADIIHQHPAADGAALGDTAHRDFRRLAAALPTLHDGGVVLNLGSAVLLPEVFLKALAVARNLEPGQPAGFVAADFDMIRHYRPRTNVVERPTRAGGTGLLFTGHHELLLPLLAWAVLDALESS